MRLSKKTELGAARRLKFFNNLQAVNQHGHTKIIRTDIGKHVAYHMPGSQNRKKTGTGHVGTKH